MKKSFKSGIMFTLGAAVANLLIGFTMGVIEKVTENQSDKDKTEE